MKLSIIIACFNEINTIEIILKKIIKLYPEEKQIIVIDDCSTDGSREILQNNIFKLIDNLVLNDKNYGKGYCVKKGIEVAEGDIILRR